MKKGLSMIGVIIGVIIGVVFNLLSNVVVDSASSASTAGIVEIVALRPISPTSTLTPTSTPTTTPTSTPTSTQTPTPTSASTPAEEVSQDTEKKEKYVSLKKVRKSINKKMDVSKPSGLSKKTFVKLIKKMDYDYTGVFERNAEYIWDLAQKYQVNEIFFMGIIANESLWGASVSAIETNNYTSQMTLIEVEGSSEEEETVYEQVLISYSSEKECFESTAKNLRKNYFSKKGKYYKGNTIYDVNKHYCVPGVHEDGSEYKYQWADSVYICMQMILN